MASRNNMKKIYKTNDNHGAIDSDNVNDALDDTSLINIHAKPIFPEKSLYFDYIAYIETVIRWSNLR